MTTMTTSVPTSLEGRVKALEDRLAVLEAAADAKPARAPLAAISHGAWEGLCNGLLAAPDRLSAWERDFLGDVSRRDAPSEKQLSVARRIEARIASGKPAPKPRRAAPIDDGIPF